MNPLNPKKKKAQPACSLYSFASFTLQAPVSRRWVDKIVESESRQGVSGGLGLGGQERRARPDRLLGLAGAGTKAAGLPGYRSL